ncbi:hypothetical protein MMC22_005702 [Lobaria immixta]|nr:hypothetical protein [Lobaria immixta]
MGLQVQGWSNVELKPRVLHYWACRTNLSALKEHEFPIWFSRNGRPTIDNDKLGVRAQWAKQTDFLKSVTVHQAEVIVTELCGPLAWSQWQRDGNLCVQSMFAWLWEGITVNGHYEAGIGQEMDDEFNIVMYHSLTQQIVRQDLEYWSLCASLRTDGNPRMVSYPYYTKHAVMGDSTEFRHNDLNVPRFLANGDGANAIQGSMSLDDETPTSCTEVLLGFHHHLDSWWTKVEARGQATNGEVHDLSTIWTKEDDEEYGPFSAVPCQRGGVRVTRPDIPHGSTATVLPDGALPQNCSSMTQPQQTPSGFTTQHFPVPERFPASVQLCPSSPVGRALICQTAWNDPRVEEEANVVLGEDRLLAQDTISQRRLEALQDFKAAFVIMKRREQAAFLEDSYF